MGSIASHEPRSAPRADLDRARLYVAWQDSDSRAIEPVGRLDRLRGAGEVIYEFRYLLRSNRIDGFRPFLSFPDLNRIYRSKYLFPFFENRLMARSRADYAGFVRTLGLETDADPFEVLARSEGRRQTDKIEVFPEPTIVGQAAQCHFLIHGVRHIPGADDAVDSLEIGDQLFVLPDPQNPFDCHAVMLRDGNFHLLGWMPRHLTELIRGPLADIGPAAMDIRVEHIGARNGPIHLRVLCGLQVRWPEMRPWPFSGPEFEVIAARD